MPTQTAAKKERIIEAVRRGLEGDAAIAFLHHCGYALNSAGIARQLKMLGGRAHVLELIRRGLSNEEVLASCLDAGHPEAAKPLAAPHLDPVDDPAAHASPQRASDADLFPTTKISIRIPTELFEAIRAAAHAERKTQNQVIVDTLTWALSRLPIMERQEMEE